MTAADAVIVLIHHEIVLDLSVLVVVLRPYYGASIIFLPERTTETARVDFQYDILADIGAFNGLNLQNWCLSDLFLRYNNSTQVELSELRVTAFFFLVITARIALAFILDVSLI